MKINKKQYVVIDLLIKKLKEVQDEMKTQIKTKEDYTYNDFCTITLTNKQREDWSKEDKIIADKYLESLGKTKIVTAQWTEARLSNIDTEAKDIVNDLFNTLLQHTEDKVITKIADKVANIQ